MSVNIAYLFFHKYCLGNILRGLYVCSYVNGFVILIWTLSCFLWGISAIESSEAGFLKSSIFLLAALPVNRVFEETSDQSQSRYIQLVGGVRYRQCDQECQTLHFV